MALYQGIERKYFNSTVKLPGTGRLKRQKVMLPVINGKIDYHYMENYIKIIEKKKIEQILEYLDR